MTGQGVSPSVAPSPRSPLDEAELNTLERGVVERARRAGFHVEVIRGSGSAGDSTRVVGRMGRPHEPTGLVHFSLTRINGKSDVWVQFRGWPARRALLAEVRAELDAMNGETK